MERIWVRVILDNKIAAQKTAALPGGLLGGVRSVEVVKEALGEVCKDMDEPRPIWLKSHERQMASFGQAVFRPEHFVEGVSFDRLEVEVIDT